MSIAEAIRQKQNTMGMVRRAIRILESAGENVETEEAEFLTLFGVPHDHVTKVHAKKVHNLRVRDIAQFRSYEANGIFPNGLEEKLRRAEAQLKLETQKRVNEHPDWCLSAEEERIIDRVVNACIRFNIDPDFYRTEFVDPLYEAEELL